LILIKFNKTVASLREADTIFFYKNIFIYLKLNNKKIFKNNNTSSYHPSTPVMPPEEAGLGVTVIYTILYFILPLFSLP